MIVVGLSLDFVSFSVVDLHVVTGPSDPPRDGWALDGLVLDEKVLVVTGLLNLTREKRYRIAGVAAFGSGDVPVIDLDQQQLAEFVRDTAGRLLYSHLRGHLNTLAGMVGEAVRFPATAPLPPDLLRSSDGRWNVRSADDASSGGLVV